MSPIASHILDTRGLRYGTIFGVIVNLVGALIKWLAIYIPDPASRYAMALVGQIVASAAQPFFLDAPTKLSKLWFSPKHQTIVVLIASVGNPLGAAFISILSPEILKGDPGNMGTLLIIGMALALAPVFLIFWIPTHPTYAFKSSSTPIIFPSLQKFLPSILRQYKRLLSPVRNRDYILTVVAFALLISDFNTILTLISDFVTTESYSENDAGLLSLLLFLPGLASAVFVSVLVSATERATRRRKHVLAARGCTAVAVVGTVVFTIFNAPGGIWGMGCGCVLVAVGGFPMLAVLLELGVMVVASEKGIEGVVVPQDGLDEVGPLELENLSTGPEKVWAACPESNLADEISVSKSGQEEAAIVGAVGGRDPTTSSVPKASQEEATISGLMWICSQISGILVLLICWAISKPIDSGRGGGEKGWLGSLVFITMTSAVANICLWFVPLIDHSA